MPEADEAGRAERDRYLEIARDIRALIPMLKDPESAEGLRLLAIRYERLAEYLEATSQPREQGQEAPS